MNDIDSSLREVEHRGGTFAIRLAIGVLVAIISAMLSTRLYADDTSSIAQAAQNPVSDVISLPFQNNSNFNTGPFKKGQNILNIQPVIPISLSKDWNLVVRTILPIVSQPKVTLNSGRVTGTGDTTLTAFLVPANAKKVIWGVGPVFLIPTTSNRRLGARRWGMGPSIVVLQIKKAWLYGVLFNNIWSFKDNPRVNQMLLQPFINYNFPSGWYLTTSPFITADWTKRSPNRWIVPLGGGIGSVFKIRKQPVNCSLQAFYNVVRPTLGPTWSLRFQVQFLFPTKS